MSALAVLERTLADSADRASWLHAHDKVIGSSTAGKFAKATSVEIYVRQILEPRTFHGNATTENGHRWEPLLLAFVGAESNSLLVHHPGDRRHAATVDGTKRDPFGRFVIVETKTKHGRDVHGPTPYEIRQIAWQLHCIPEADYVEWVWIELDLTDGEWVPRRDPQTLVFHRDDSRIVAALQLIVPIADAVLAALDAAPVLEGAF